MSAANFPAAMAFTLAEEGGFVDNPADPGGATNKGITLAMFQAYLHGATVKDLVSITDAEVFAIYRRGYWNAVSADALPSGLDLMVFDFGVNTGPGRSVRLMQETIGVDADGQIGPVTLARLGQMKVTGIIATLGQMQAAYYRGLDGFASFGDGWLARTTRRQAAALALAGR
jgi:lysozyme family protein